MRCVCATVQSVTASSLPMEERQRGKRESEKGQQWRRWLERGSGEHYIGERQGVAASITSVNDSPVRSVLGSGRCIWMVRVTNVGFEGADAVPCNVSGSASERAFRLTDAVRADREQLRVTP
jgi:hypothetical protein